MLKHERKIITIEQYVMKKSYYTNEMCIGFTNGVFDILHPGHIDYLTQSKCQCDILIVGLNSDSSVKRLKGPKRPIMNQYERSIVLSALECIDYIIIFDEDTPYNLIEKIKPNLLFKGADYQKEQIAGWNIVEQNGGEVVLIPLKDGFSSTKIIDKVVNEWDGTINVNNYHDKILKGV